MAPWWITRFTLFTVYLYCLYRPSLLSLPSIEQNWLLSFFKTLKLTVTIDVFSAGKYFEGVNCPGAENEMKPLVQNKTHHSIQQRAESAQHVDSICPTCGQYLPNMWVVFAQHVGSICPTCGQYSPNMYRLYLPVLPNIRAVFAQQKDIIVQLLGKCDLLGTLYPCWAKIFRHDIVVYCPAKRAQQNRNL